MNFPTLRTPRGEIPAGRPHWNRQRPSRMPSHRYRDVHARVEVPLTDRRWPAQRLQAPPLWVPVDLRDGNQALAEPMDPARKRRFLELMITMGFKEIEVGYPSASQTDFDFVRLLADSGLVPDDVTVAVFTPARADLIERTFAAIEGLPNVVVHMYTATAPTWRHVVLGKTRAELAALIREGGELIARLAGDAPGIRFEFSPEVFILTEPDYVLEVCDMMTGLWDASPDRPVIHNLPATVEVATPNVYADQIEYMHRQLARRDSVILSVHPHNDRGTGVACAELAVLAGAQRVEGCLFGNGERTGNVDLVTLALNLHAQGIDPMIDFGDIDEIRRTVEHCNRIGVHERHPYGGDLVYTAFSGTHQDAIKKGLAEHREQAGRLGTAESDAPWQVPYLPIDPADVGRSYQEVIRVNSQSGKGGIAYLLGEHRGLDLPRRLQIDFARVVQEHTDSTGREVSAERLWELFTAAYMTTGGPWSLEDGDPPRAVLAGAGATGYPITGPDPVQALVDVLADAGHKLEVLELTRDGDTAYLEYRRESRVGWAVGTGTSAHAAALAAVITAANHQPTAAPSLRWSDAAR